MNCLLSGFITHPSIRISAAPGTDWLSKTQLEIYNRPTHNRKAILILPRSHRHAEETLSFDWRLRYGYGVIGRNAQSSRSQSHRLRQGFLSADERRVEATRNRNFRRLRRPPFEATERG